MRKVLALTVGLLCALAALAACSSGGSKSSGGKNAEFTSLYDKSKTATLRVTYSTLDESGNTTDTWTISQEGQGKSAYIQKDSKIVTVNGTTTSCDNLSDSPSCETLPGDTGNLAAGFTGLYTAAGQGIAAAATSGGIGKTSSDTIAGRSAECATVTVGGALGKLGGAVAKALGGNTKAGYETCIDKDTGFLLKWVVVGVNNDKSGIIATKVDQPQDSDFETPTTTTTSEQPTDTTADTSETTTPDTSSGGSGTTAPCNEETLPDGITLPSGITLPCVSPG